MKKLHGAGSTVAVIGLGYVGLPLALEFAKKTKVIGFDTNSAKIEQYKQGKDPTGDTGEASVASSSMIFTSDPEQLREADVFIVAVPTPVHADNTVDLSPVRGASTIVGKFMAAGSLIIYESTVYPGVTQNVCIPLLEHSSGMKAGEDFFVGYSPERINPGDKEHALTQVTKVISGQDEETLEDVARVYGLIFDGNVPGKLYKAGSIMVAEACKVVENTQRDINIAFMNEIACIMHRLGVDTAQVLDAMKTKWNSLSFKPGLVGGHCIGVDPYYLIQEAERHEYTAHFLLAARGINEEIPLVVAQETVRELIRAGKNPSTERIFVLGLTFKANVKDMRNSKVYQIVQALEEGYGLTPYLIDPVADADEIESIYDRKPTDISLLKDADCIIISAPHRVFTQWTDAELVQRLCNVFSRAYIENLGFRYWSL